MTSNELEKLMSNILAAYPHYKLPDKDGIKYWFRQLKNYPLQACIESLDYHVKYEKYPPTLIDFVKYGPETNEDLKKLFVNYKSKT